MFGRAGIPLAGIQAAVGPTKIVLEGARDAGMLVVYLTMGFSDDLADLGSATAPNRTRHLALGVGQSVDAPDGSPSRVLVRDTWNTAIIDELAPHAGDVVVAKHRYSGFFQTELDAVLRDHGITSLIFTGCTTSVCVESTLRDAFYRDYQCLLLTDCCAEAIGSDQARTNHDATLAVIERVSVGPADPNTCGLRCAVPPDRHRYPHAPPGSSVVNEGRRRGPGSAPDRRVRERRRRRPPFAPTTLRSGRHWAPTGHQRAVSDGHQHAVTFRCILCTRCRRLGIGSGTRSGRAADLAECLRRRQLAVGGTARRGQVLTSAGWSADPPRRLSAVGTLGTPTACPPRARSNGHEQPLTVIDGQA